MIVVMKEGSTKEQVEHVVKRVREMGLKDHVIIGEERTVVAVIGNDRFKDHGVLENVDGVDRVVPILAPYKMASLEMKKERSVVPMGSDASARIGGKRIGVIAGPCSVESKKQTLEIAHAVKEAGAVALRGGAFKPRTNPYSFQGMAEKGLDILAEAREQTGLAIVTEVMAVEQVALVAKYADVLQIGARNMQNFNLLNAVGDQPKPILLKRGMSATLEEFLLAAEYIMSHGNQKVMLCERGIRTYEEYVRNTLALAAVPELHRVTHLPVIVDPSQGTGKSNLVDSMCRAAVAAGADGLIIEVHNDPEHAMTDGAQSITPPMFADMMKAIRRIAAAVDREV
ncbi:MAG: 3-deoxy-7-phosphoheptulonate synthase [Phycisphaerales bacterium]|jgi:3-deoxy-7-phosphoheptulonate synthase|nr:3-deoxy-7-phosphoheptulonate synthase [Phycisphaerales bacterium]